MKRIVPTVCVIALVFGVASIAQTPAQPLVELNHVYVTLQKDTIDSIAKSAFISEQFSMFEQKTTKTVSESWTGTYLMGWRGYLELFAPGGSEGLTDGSSGIGFSASKLGIGEAIKRKLESLPGEKTLSDLSRKVEGKDSILWGSVRYSV